jgi:hypothetical protein
LASPRVLALVPVLASVLVLVLVSVSVSVLEWV